MLTLAKARSLAKEKGLDLVLIAPLVVPPVARVISFDKFRYLKEKEAKKQRLAQKAPEMKRVQISPREAKNDLLMKIERLKSFLEDGHRVEVHMRLRGRENYMKDWARQKMDEFLTLIPFEYKLIQDVHFEGRALVTQIDTSIKPKHDENENQKERIKENKDNKNRQNPTPQDGARPL